MLVSSFTFMFGGGAVSGHPLSQSAPPDDGTVPGTIPPTATPSGTLPVPACPEEVKAPEVGKMHVFLGPVAIYSGCIPQVQAAALLTDTGFIPTLLYHNPEDGFPEAFGYVGEVYATFDYSAEELERLVTVLESFRCEEVGMPLKACRQVNGIRISETGYRMLTAVEMRLEASADANDRLGAQAETIYLPVGFTR